ncbi:MAG TPA: glutaminyl-peptide cyclotransferase [Chloroflexota bacterium]|nr:glutaminyl-peptide cyclotransferase [Chloroflexota bacterium]
MACRVRVLWKTPGLQPNGLQAAAEGLWVLDQVDPNRVYLLRYEDGAVLREFETRGKHGSGITVDSSGRVWIASTFGYELICYDPETGREVAAIPAPGAGAEPGAPHGLEWRDGHLWCNVPRAGRIFELDPTTGRVLHQISAHGDRAHGMAWETDDLWCLGINPASALTPSPVPDYEGRRPWRSARGLPALWCADTNKRVLFRLNPETGAILDALGVSGLEAHGMTIHGGTFWLCDAGTRDVFVLEKG